MAKMVKRLHFKDRKTGELVYRPVLEKQVKIGKKGKKRLYCKAETEDGRKLTRQVTFDIFKKIKAPTVREE